MRNYRRRNPRSRAPKKSSGISDGTKLALVVGGLAAVAGIGYLVYQSQSSSTAAGTGGATSGAQATTLGPAGSSSALGPAAGTSGGMQPTAGVTDTSPTEYEAGAGSDAPLVPTVSA